MDEPDGPDVVALTPAHRADRFRRAIARVTALDAKIAPQCRRGDRRVARAVGHAGPTVDRVAAAPRQGAGTGRHHRAR
ncbi:hypothetical protein, partial [Novilysobacter selenitireducens]